MSSRISIIIPAFNEESSIGLVLDALPQELIHEIIVVNNNSTDDTARVATEHGARVVEETRRGYGSACLRGMDELDAPDIVVFLDGDFSDFPEEIFELVNSIEKGESDFVLGSRMILPESRMALFLLPQLHQIYLFPFYYRYFSFHLLNLYLLIYKYFLIIL